AAIYVSAAYLFPMPHEERGSPIAILLMNHFKSANSVGVKESMAVIGVVYLIAMLCGAFGYRVPPDGWKPDGWTAPNGKSKALITHGHVHLDNAHKTPQFWLIWIVLCMNVSAGIGVLAMASPMLQEIFAGKLIGLPDVRFGDLTPAQATAIAGIAGGFVSLLSLFNSGGRFLWASLSDIIGRKTTYFCFFVFGMALYGVAPTLAHAGSIALFVAAFCVILTMYGGGFSTVPAYLADIFGTQFVGAIHGRLLTAWSTAGVLGPLVIGYLRDAQIAAGVPRALVYDRTMYILAGFLLIGFIANALIRPVADKWLMSEAEVAKLQAAKSTANVSTGSHGIGFGGMSPAALIAWIAVAIPFFWGVWNTFGKAAVLFR
ncbi:MAG TPA: MFS transporter, partial [Hyphomicrobium sp.]|nr:MFS transporter [Hyphomicrobium sp.]